VQTLVSGGLVRPFVARFGERVALALALASGALGFAVYAFAPNGGLFMSGVAFIALWGMANPSFQALATRLASASEQGRLQGALSSLRAVSGMIGPLLFTQIFSLSVSAGVFPGGAYFLSSVLLALSLVVALAATARAT